MLSKIDQEERYLKSFSKTIIPAKELFQFLESNKFWPTEVKDYGEIPCFFKYLDEFETSIYIDVEPWFNNHHEDNHPRSITSISFGKGNAPFNNNRIKLGDVIPVIYKKLFDKITILIKKHGKEG